MSLNIADNFSYLGGKPLDTRLVFETIDDMSSFSESSLYDGILSYCKEDNKFYTYNSNNLTTDETGKWEEFNSGSSSTSSTELLEYTQATLYTKDSLVYFKEYLCRVSVDFTSSSISDIDDAFEFDLNAGYLVPFTHQVSSTLNEYTQSTDYKHETFVYNDSLIYRVVDDFESSSDPDLEEAINSDIANGHLILLNREAEPEILPYQQNTFYAKDKLLFLDKQICIVSNDFISNDTEATLEESMNVDIALGHLQEIGETYKFKLYKTSQDLNKDIDGINEIDVSTITFDSNDDIFSMNVNECIYGPLGTLALITDIDVNTGIITAKSISTRDIDVMPSAPDSCDFEILLHGMGYSVGDVVATDDPGVYAEVTSIGDSGDILSVVKSSNRLMPTSGSGASILVTRHLYGGNGKNWSKINLSEGSSLSQYGQNKEYSKNDLIFYAGFLYYATSDFTSDNLESTVEESLSTDISDNLLIPIEGKLPPIPNCIGDLGEESTIDGIEASDGDWGVISNCDTTLPGQPGIGIKEGNSWVVIPFPKGQMQFPEPSDEGKYFRSIESGATSGTWEKFEGIDGNEYPITISSKTYDDGDEVPSENELVWYEYVDDDSGRTVHELVIGDGITSLSELNPFYSKAYTRDDIVTLLGFEPENTSKKGIAEGYAPLDANGIVPEIHLPQNLVDSYSKDETDDIISDLDDALTLAINSESSRAAAAEIDIQTTLDDHVNDDSLHVTQYEKDVWDAKVDPSDLIDYDNHITDNAIHVTQSDKDKWDGMNKAYFVTSISNLPSTDNEIGNIGYVQTSAAGVTPIVCKQYIWTGTAWKEMDSSGVSLTFNWDNLIGKPAATPLTIDNVVTVAHSHTNKAILEKIGQTPGGAFTFDGVPIGVKAVFFENEELLPEIGEADTLYVVYSDSRTRKYPSISVYKDNAYQILGKGAQESAPVVGDMQILQAEYYSVQANSSYTISYSTPNQFFCFLPIEILKEIAGPTNQTYQLATLNDSENYVFNSNLITIDATNYCKIDIKPLETTVETVSDSYISYVEVNIDDYRDVQEIS